MKKFIVLVALFFVGIFFGQESVKALTKEDIPLEVANAVDVSTLTFVIDTEPQFPGGMTEFRKEFSKNFDKTALKKLEGDNIKTVIYYVVETDGSILYAKAIGDNESLNKEAEKALLAIKTKYSPASVNNLIVRYLLKMPLVMIFK